MGKSKKKLSSAEMLQEAVENIRSDRTYATVLLVELMPRVKETSDSFRNLGGTAAKLLETLQRSNEQLVKVADILKKGSRENLELTDEDKENIFDTLQEEANKLDGE